MSEEDSAQGVHYDVERRQWIVKGRWGALTACPCCNKPFPTRERAQLCADNLGIIDAAIEGKARDA